MHDEKTLRRVRNYLKSALKNGGPVRPFPPPQDHISYDDLRGMINALNWVLGEGRSIPLPPDYEEE